MGHTVHMLPILFTFTPQDHWGHKWNVRQNLETNEENFHIPKLGWLSIFHNHLKKEYSDVR